MFHFQMLLRKLKTVIEQKGSSPVGHIAGKAKWFQTIQEYSKTYRVKDFADVQITELRTEILTHLLLDRWD